MTTKTNTDTRRRTLLKSIAAGSGAVIAGKSLPDTWKKPVIDSVFLPAHAQTSDEERFTGLFRTQNSAIGRANDAGGVRHASRGVGGRLLDWLVPAARAEHVISGICDRQFNVTFQIPGGDDPRTVMICVETFESRTSATTSISGNTLSDVTIPLIEDLEPGCGTSDEELILTGMTVGPGGVTGDIQTNDTDSGETAGECSDTFVAVAIDGSFSCPEGCLDT